MQTGGDQRYQRKLRKERNAGFTLHDTTLHDVSLVVYSERRVIRPTAGRIFYPLRGAGFPLVVSIYHLLPIIRKSESERK